MKRLAVIAMLLTGGIPAGSDLSPGVAPSPRHPERGGVGVSERKDLKLRKAWPGPTSGQLHSGQVTANASDSTWHVHLPAAVGGERSVGPGFSRGFETGMRFKPAKRATENRLLFRPLTRAQWAATSQTPAEAGAYRSVAAYSGSAQPRNLSTNHQPATSNNPSPTPANTITPTNPPNTYLGVGTCVNSGCHGSTEPLNASPVLQNEFYTWLNNDRHAGAYNVLLTDRSARIARNMRLRQKAWQETLCLDCHTTNVPVAQITGIIDPEDGIQCEACHGPAAGWRAEHTEEGWTHEKSIARGMTDLRRIDNRAALCGACHVGNAKKEVAHELIASGHPLLAFELDNFTETMPPHWALNYEGGRDTHGVRAWAVGQLVQFRQSLDNLARHARGDNWPEFSDMSCTNCHHDLATGAPRQQRGYPDRAGLPAWSPQHWAMLRPLLARVSPQTRDQLDPLIRQLARAVSHMNDPSAVATTADRARKLTDPLVSQVDNLRWTDTDIRTLMTTIASDRDFILTSDVQAAEQTALALQSLSSALTRRNPRLLRSNMTRAIDALFDEVRNRDEYDAGRFVEKLGAVKSSL
jgi:hypothetical protein